MVIVSDGWDTGDPQVVRREMERLSLVAHRIVWVNPRTKSASYQPLAGGMAAAWPHCDAVVSAHTVQALDQLTAALADPARRRAAVRPGRPAPPLRGPLTARRLAGGQTADRLGVTPGGRCGPARGSRLRCGGQLIRAGQAASVLDVTVPRVAIGPAPSEFAVRAVRAGGGEAAEIDAQADALVWLDPADIAGLRRALDAARNARWVQLPMAGIEHVTADGLLDHDRTWTSAKGAYAEPVAEHALTLALAGLRVLRRRIMARTLGRAGRGEPLRPAGDDPRRRRHRGEAPGAARAVRVTATVVRRRTEPVPGAARTVDSSRLHEALAGARVVFLALALTPSTEQVIGAAELDRMRSDAWLVNVARGRHVDTDALVAALRREAIGGAALDVTDPEPLPDGHPLWELERCIITPHTADTEEMVQRLLAQRIKENVARFAAGGSLAGVIDAAAGY